jgi:spermidine synthase
MAPARVVAALHVLFFASGAASLACEVVWFKQLGFVLGSSNFSATVVVACFFGGLSVGSALLGRIADRVKHPLRVYGALELLLAVTALATTAMLASWEQWIGWFTPWMSLDAASARPAKVALALPILLPPTILMGATLPVLARYVVRSHGELGARIGWLYALNTLGAATGCAAVGWYGIGALGVFGSAAVGAAVYAAIGVIGLALAATTEPPPPVDIVRDPHPPSASSGPMPLVWVALFAGSGFVAIGYEVLWFRMLRYFAAHTVYTFSTFLTVYLLGLVLGSVICARWLAPRKDQLAASFARVQLGIGLAALVSFAVLGRSRHILHLVSSASSYSALESGSLLGLVVLAVLVLLPPTVLLGLAFPLASELAVGSMRTLGARIGLLYAANTLGGVLGSLVAGFVLLPTIGAQHAFEVLIVANVALFGIVWWLDPALRARREVRREAVLTLLTIAVSVALLGPGYLRHSQTDFANGQLLDFRENEDAAFVVMEYDEPHIGKYQQIIVNGTSYANNRPSGRRYMAMLGHLPMLLHDDPRQAVVICVGTGTTIGGVSLHPELERGYAVDLTASVFDLAPHFVPINNRFHQAPNVSQVVADGRHFLLVGDGQYDVLTFEPPPPQQAGVVNLYSAEFYALADRRLADGGLVAQWIPFHQGYVDLQKSLVRTVADRFEHVSLWMPNGGEGVVIAGHQPLRIDPVRIAARMAEPAVRADLAAVGVDSVEDLLAMFVAADEALAPWVGEVPSLTDDRPVIEYFLGYEDIQYRNALLEPALEPVERHLSGPVPSPERLRRARQQIALQWAAEDAVSDARWDDAVRLAEEALALEPSDAFLRYMAAQLRDWREDEATEVAARP